MRVGQGFTEEQVRVEMAKSQAILNTGRKFIALRLLDIKKNRIQGAIILDARSYKDLNGLPAFHFEEHGGPIEFTLDPYKGGMYAGILDCEHNRKFLASHMGFNFWEIEDEKIRAEIQEMANEITNKAIGQVRELPKVEEEILSDEEIEVRMAKLQQEQSKRKVATSELKSKKGMLKPVEPEVETKAVVDELKAEGIAVETFVPNIEEKSQRKTRKRKSGLVTVE